jgi:Zn-dependent peptidase ImmA (M78 family)
MRRWARIEKLAGVALAKVKAKAFKVDPYAVAKAYGAEVVEISDDSSSSGMVTRQGARIIIGVNRFHSETRQRFTVAHEIGHMLLHADQPLIVDHDGLSLIGRRNEGESGTREREANAFAAALLMPEDWVRQAVAGQEIPVEGDEKVAALAKKFGVSQQAMIFRMMNLGEWSNLG